MQHLLWVVSEDNFRTHVHNIRHHIRKYERSTPNESEAARTARAQLLAKYQECCKDHRTRWLANLYKVKLLNIIKVYLVFLLNKL
jgi:hypothetical protein